MTLIKTLHHSKNLSSSCTFGSLFDNSGNELKCEWKLQVFLKKCFAKNLYKVSKCYHSPLTISSISNRSWPTVLLATQTYSPLSAAVMSRMKSELSTCTIRPALLMRYVVATDSPEAFSLSSAPASPMRKTGTWSRLSLLVAVAETPPEDPELPPLFDGVDSMDARYQLKVGHGCACVEQGSSTVSPDWTTRWRKLAMILGGIRDWGSVLKKKEKIRIVS